MKKIVVFCVIVLLVVVVGVKVTNAYFSSVETNRGNILTAGTLILSLDENTGSAKFNVADLKPGDTKTGTWKVVNGGNVNGFLDLHNLTQLNEGNVQSAPEIEAGDTNNQGNLGELLTVLLFVDTNHNGVFEAGETSLYNGQLNAMNADFDENISLFAAETKYITLSLNWPTHGGSVDNKGQGDKLTFEMTFELGQSTEQ